MHDADKLRVAIVGAGIGGLTAALALRQSGHHVCVYEKARRLEPIGAGIHVSPNGVRLLLRLGLASALAKIAGVPEYFEFKRWDDGRLLQRHDINPFCERHFGAPFYCFHRGELHSALLNALGEEHVVCDHRVTDVSEAPDGVELFFANEQRGRADLVVGADGIRSTLRSRLLVDQPRFGKMHSFRGVIPAESTKVPRPQHNTMWLGPDRTMILYPVSAGKSYNFTGVYPSNDELSESWVEQGSQEHVLQQFAGWDEELRTAIAAAEQVLVYPLFDRLPVEQWGRGRITLLGDAAHPMFPFLAQGAVQAIEDAWVLGRELQCATRATVEDGLRRYEARRVVRAGAIQERSAGANWLLFHDGPEQEERDRWLASLKGDPSAWVHAYDAETDRDVV